jgi:hypothetical protein
MLKVKQVFTPALNTVHSAISMPTQIWANIKQFFFRVTLYKKAIFIVAVIMALNLQIFRYALRLYEIILCTTFYHAFDLL